jgi:lecithin:cholesterol acyltransferase
MHSAGERIQKESLASSLHYEISTPKIEQKEVGNIPAVECARTPPRPLIFVPGVSVSTLARKIKNDKGEEQWQYFWPPPMNLPQQDKDRIMFNGLRCDVCSRPEDLTSVKAMGLYPRAYDYLVDALGLSGYRLNVNFWIFPYDWRQSNRVSGKLLADFIKEKVGESGSAHCDGDGVDIINHSMGGLATRAAAKLYQAHIKRTVYIACPHYGNPLAYFVLRKDVPYDKYTLTRLPEYTVIPGNGIDFNNLQTTIDAARAFNNKLENAFKELPSMYELLPDPFYLKTKPFLYVDNEPKHTFHETYLEGDWGFTEGCAVLVRDAMRFKCELGEDLPGDNNLVIYGAGLDTPDTITYQRKFFASNNNSNNDTQDKAQRMFSSPYYSDEKGDTWVPELSGMGPPESDKTGRKPESFCDSHTLLPNNVDVIKRVLNFLADDKNS